MRAPRPAPAGRNVGDDHAGGWGVAAAATDAPRARGRWRRASLRGSTSRSALGARVVDLSRRGLRLTSGAIMPADVVVWTVGDAPRGGPHQLGDDAGRPGLRAVRRDAAQRVASRRVRGRGIGRHGDRAHRQRRGVLRRRTGTAIPSLPALRPGSSTLLDCGDGSALLAYGGIAREGRMAMRLKESLDRRFISRYQRLAGAT